MYIYNLGDFCSMYSDSCNTDEAGGGGRYSGLSEKAV